MAPPGGLEVDYVCSPVSIRVSAREDLSIRMVRVALHLNDKLAHQWAIRMTLDEYGDKDALDSVVRKVIKFLMTKSEDSVLNQYGFLVGNVYSSLEVVQTKMGKTIWKR